MNAPIKTKGNPASAQPMRNLSQRAQQQLRPSSFGMSVSPRVLPDTIPQALRSRKD